jgi:hypothetical protein
MKSAYTRTGQRTFHGMLDDTKKSLERVYQVNFKVFAEFESTEYLGLCFVCFKLDVEKSHSSP